MNREDDCEIVTADDLLFLNLVNCALKKAEKRGDFHGGRYHDRCNI